MERVIGLLFDIEKKANQIIERANIEKTELYEENEKAIIEMENIITDENNAKINLIISQAENDLEIEKKQLVDNSNIQLKDLEDNYNKNHDCLVDKVFKIIIQTK